MWGNYGRAARAFINELDRENEEGWSLLAVEAQLHYSKSAADVAIVP